MLGRSLKRTHIVWPIAPLAAGCLGLLTVFLTSEVSRAAEGYLVEVTAESAPIKTRDEVLATVTKGTRRWALQDSEDGQWVQVKVPEGEQLGWLLKSQVRVPTPTAAAQARLDEAYGRYGRGQTLYGEGDLAAAIVEMKACLIVEQELVGNDHPQVADSLNAIGYALWELEEYDEAKPLLEEALAIRRDMLGQRHIDTINSRINVALVLDSLGDYETARALNEETLAICRDTLGDADSTTATVLNNLGWTCSNQEDYVAAAGRFEEAYRARSQALGEAELETLGSLRNWADMLKYQGQFAAAKEKHQEALERFRAAFGDKHHDTLQSMYDVASVLSDLGEYSASRKIFEETLVLYREVVGEKEPGTLDVLNDLGVVLSNDGDYVGAVARFREAVELHREVFGERHRDTLLTRANLANQLSNLGEYKESRRLHEHVLADCYEELGEADSLSLMVLNNFGWVLYNLGEHSEAAAKVEEAYRLRRETLGERHLETLSSLNDVAQMLYLQGDYPAAKEKHAESVNLCREVLGEKHPDTLLAQSNLADVVLEMGDYQTARKMHQQTLDLRQEILGERHPSTLASLDCLATTFLNLGDYAASRDLYEKVYRIRTETLGPRHPDTLYSMRMCACGRANLGDYRGARALAEENLQLCREVFGDDDLMTVGTMNVLAAILNLLDENEAARDMQAEALRTFRRDLGDRHPWTLSTMRDLAVAQANLKEFAAARELLEEQLMLSREIMGPRHPATLYSMQALGGTLTALLDYPAGRRMLDEVARTFADTLGETHPDTLDARQDLALALVNMGEASAVAEVYQQVRHSTRRFQSQLLPALSEREQLTFLESTDSDRLSECLSFALDSREDHRIAALSAGWLVNGKAVAQEALAETSLLSKPETAPLIKKLRSVRSRLAKLNSAAPTPQQQQQIAALETEQQQLVRQIGAAGTGMSRQDPWISLAALRGELRPGTVMINVARLRIRSFTELVDRAKMWQPTRYVAWIIPPMDEGRVQVIDLGLAEEIDALVSEAQTTLNKSVAQARLFGEPAAEKSYREALEKLSGVLIAPLESAIEDADHLLLSPDGALWLVPWGALPIGDGKYLIERAQIDYLTSGRELVVRRAARTAIGPPVVMADPAFDRVPGTDDSPSKELLARRSAEQMGRVAPLPGTAAEARAIRPSLATYAGSEPTIHLGASASETEFKRLYRPRTLVVSTHGFFLADQRGKANVLVDDVQSALAARTADGKPLENPLLRCGLLLAGCNQRDTAEGTDDGVLTGLEIVGTDLRGTELVVLSACETGVGEIRNGEGVAGLRQAFQLAGAESVVATLWKIPDQETARLMNDFFKNLADGQAKGAALRNAQLARIEARRNRYGAAHPFFWAAFTLTGSN